MRFAALGVVVATACGRVAFDPLGTDIDEEVAMRATIATGESHSCVIREDRSVWCWGENRSGQLTGSPTSPSATPARVPGLTDIIAIAAGREHTCAIDGAGALWCWGSNQNGQVTGTDTTWQPPTQVALPSRVVSVGPGGYHTCAALDDGRVFCWGKNTHGQLGAGPIDGTARPPQEVLDGVTAVSSGRYHSCAIRGGYVWCWGSNDSSQLGNGETTMLPTPSATPGIRADSISAGGDYTCAVDTGHIRCWGYNNDGQLGTTIDPRRPSAPSALVDVVAVRAGQHATCALREGGVTDCWGNNMFGTLGNGGTSGTAVPTPTTLGYTRDIAIGGDHTCAVTVSGGVACSGLGGRGGRRS